MDSTIETRLHQVEKKLETMTRMLESNLAWQRKFSEFVEEMSPVARAVMETSSKELGELERRGYFVLAGDLAQALRRVAEVYQPDSLPDLAESFGDVVHILRLLSQPKILAVAQDLADEFERAGSEPVEVLGAARRIESEKDIQRGIAFALDLFGTMGRSLARAPRLKTGRKPPVRASRNPSRVVSAPLSAPSPERQEADDFAFVPEAEWSREWASTMAARLGVGPLDEERWKIVEFSRKDYLETRKAPNIRRITKLLNINTKDVYELFPSAPGPTISKLAGVPKPAGCL
ncbi:TusE/DsrC/DsvC family sulfur relay protein [bacterium]|nr:TusE/DsrC/DsvC family sulfur relay protein [bacterium]